MPSPALLQRLKERKLVQWALAYLAGAWVLVESSNLVVERFHWPEVIGQAVIVAAFFGFFFILVLAWYHGEKGRQRVSGVELLILAGLLIGAGVTISMLRPVPEAESLEGGLVLEAAGIIDDRPAVAALPFANLSRAEGDAYLAPGLHEEVISQLSKIAGLRVVSRTSVMGYAEPGSNLPRVAADLGVSTILEGTVQKVLDRVRVTTQLIDASTDELLWSERFDREITLESLLDIQAEVATKIAEALRIELTSDERSRVEARYTEDLGAYQAYLRGRYFQRLPHFSEEDLARASREFLRAVQLDSTFALAWMEVANAHAQEVYFWTDASPERREMARSAAERAIRLDSRLPEVRLAMGLYHLWLERDPDRALEEIARAEEGLPNNQSVYEARAAVYELLGRYDDAIGEYRKALNLSPNDPSVLTLMSWDYWTLRQYQAAESLSEQAMNLAPDQMWPNLMNVLTIWSDRGPTPGTLETLEALPLSLDWVLWGRFWQYMWEDLPEEALGVLAEADSDWVLTKMWARPTSLLKAFAYRAMGRTQDAIQSFEEARNILEQEVEAHPDDPRFFSSLALSYAGLGRSQEAALAGEEAVALLPVSEDAYYGLTFLWDLAAVRAMAGDVDQAMQGLEHLLTVPSWVSGPWLAGDFRLDPIRDHPRFQAMLERYAEDVEH